ncbi:protein-L-histidine N-pros-methyltransferase-like isoform X2 [Tubulanus polymorphus]
MYRYAFEESDDGFPIRHTLRSPLARAVYDRMKHQQKHQNSTHRHWYEMKMDNFPPRLVEKYVASEKDQESAEFLENCYDKADWIFTQIWQGVAKSFLTWFVSVTSANALLGRGSMFVFSRNQFHSLIQKDETWKAKKLLDLGAGDGVVTRVMEPNFDEVFVTEVSKPMIWKLEEKNYKVLGIDDWANGSHQFDLTACLNVLDRCSKPLSILTDIKRSLVPGGRVVIAVVLPFRPYVENGKNQHKPEEYVPVKGHTFEEQVKSFIEDVFEPNGFTVERFTRVPYLCEGDLQQSFYVLDDAVFVLRASDESYHASDESAHAGDESIHVDAESNDV